MSKSSLPDSPIKVFLIALPFAGAGALVMLVAADVIHADPSSFHAPRWVVGMAGFLFFLAGLWILFLGFAKGSEAETTLGQWASYIFFVLFLGTFALIFLWVGFGPGEREFSSSGSIGPVTISGAGNELVGRCLFGGVGLLVGAVALWVALVKPMQALGSKSPLSDPDKKDVKKQ